MGSARSSDSTNAFPAFRLPLHCGNPSEFVHSSVEFFYDLPVRTLLFKNFDQFVEIPKLLLPSSLDMALQRTRSLFSSDALLALGTTVFAASLWGVAEFKSVALLSVAILFGGIAWTAIISLMTTVMQNLAPDWVRARAMAVFMLVYMGTWTAGSAFWGYIAGRHGTHFSLITASIDTAVCPILVLISRLPDTPVDLGAWDHWGKPMLVGDIDPSQGPVLVTVEYEVESRKSDEFL